MKKVGEFTAEARDTKIDGQPVVAAWDDGVMISADNGKSAMFPGQAPHVFKLKAGKKYKITVEEV